MKYNALLTTVSLSIFAMPVQAFAQTETYKDEVVVTGEKISRSLQDTATSVAVVTALDIEEKNILTLKDVMDQTANVATTNGTTFTIRGIASTNVSGAGLGDLATIYIDGSPLPRDAIYVSPVDIWDLEQVEIFRGPQSTLQGRNTLAGAIIVNTADPSYDWHGRARVIVSTGTQEKRLGVAVGGPIVDDQIAFRIAGEISDTLGIVRNPIIETTEDASDGLYLRGKLLVEPQSIPDLTILLSHTYDERHTGNNYRSLDVADPYNNAQVFGNRSTIDDLDLDISVLTVDYDVNDTFSFTSISGYNVATRERAGDSDLTPVDKEYFTQTSNSKTFTQELRLTVGEGPVTGVLGGYYSNLDVIGEGETIIALDVINDLGLVSSLVGGFGLDVPTATFIAGFYSAPVVVNSQYDNPYTVKTHALFGDFTYQASDRFRVFGGFRYDKEKQNITTGNAVSIVSALPDPAGFPAQLAPVIAGVNAFLEAEAQDATSQPLELKSPNFGAFLPKAGISWDIADERNISFIVQRGYRSGGVGINIARAQTFDFDQEFIWNYELSWRSRWLDNALTLNANAFYIDWTDQQVTVQLSGNSFDTDTQNAGSSEVKGFEIEADYYVSEGLNIYGSVGYADSEFKEFFAQINGAQVDLSGNAFAYSPKWTLAAGFTWKNENGFFVNANGNYNSAMFRRANRVQTTRNIDSRLIANAKVGWDNDTYSVYLIAKNLFDKKHLSSYYSNDISRPDNMPEFGIYAQAQTFAVQLEAKF